MNTAVVQQLHLQPLTMSAGLTTKQSFCVAKQFALWMCWNIVLFLTWYTVPDNDKIYEQGAGDSLGTDTQL